MIWLGLQRFSSLFPKLPNGAIHLKSPEKQQLKTDKCGCIFRNARDDLLSRENLLICNLKSLKLIAIVTNFFVSFQSNLFKINICKICSFSVLSLLIFFILSFIVCNSKVSSTPPNENLWHVPKLFWLIKQSSTLWKHEKHQKQIRIFLQQVRLPIIFLYRSTVHSWHDEFLPLFLSCVEFQTTNRHSLFFVAWPYFFPPLNIKIVNK